MKVIAFSGRARCGKSYISSVIAKALWDSGKYIPVILPLAQPLKDAAAEAGFTKTGDPQGYRNYCQTVGAEAREADPNHWLYLWHNMYLDAMMRELGSKQEYVVIVDDVRYENELRLINGMANATTVFVDEGSRHGTLEDDFADWRNHHSEYLANEAQAHWNLYKDQFDYRFANDDKAFENLEAYVTAGDDCGKVIEAWLGNHDCDCVLCTCHITNSSLDDEAIESLDELLAPSGDEDIAAINRTLGTLFGIEDVDIEDILEKLDEEEDETDDDS